MGIVESMFNNKKNNNTQYPEDFKKKIFYTDLCVQDKDGFMIEMFKKKYEKMNPRSFGLRASRLKTEFLDLYDNNNQNNNKMFELVETYKNCWMVNLVLDDTFKIKERLEFMQENLRVMIYIPEKYPSEPPFVRVVSPILKPLFIDGVSNDAIAERCVFGSDYGYITRGGSFYCRTLIPTLPHIPDLIHADNINRGVINDCWRSTISIKQVLLNLRELIKKVDVYNNMCYGSYSETDAIRSFNEMFQNGE